MVRLWSLNGTLKILLFLKELELEPRPDCRVWTPGPFLKCLAAVRKKHAFDGRVTMIP